MKIDFDELMTRSPLISEHRSIVELVTDLRKALVEMRGQYDLLNALYQNAMKSIQACPECIHSQQGPDKPTFKEKIEALSRYGDKIPKNDFDSDFGETPNGVFISRKAVLDLLA